MNKIKEICVCILGFIIGSSVLVGGTLLPFILISIIMGICGIIGGFLWTYVINTWLVFFGKEAIVLFWHGFLLGMIPKLGILSIPCAILTFIVMLII